MSDRDEVRGLAEEIRSLSLDLLRKGRHVDCADVKPLITALLAEREANLKRKLRAAAGDVVETFLDARPPGTVDLVYDKIARKLGLEDSDGP